GWRELLADADSTTVETRLADNGWPLPATSRRPRATPSPAGPARSENCAPRGLWPAENARPARRCPTPARPCRSAWEEAARAPGAATLSGPAESWERFETKLPWRYKTTPHPRGFVESSPEI